MPRVMTLKANSQLEIADYPEAGMEDSLKFLQNIVGGYIEFIDLPKQKAVMVVNEEGKLNGLPTNVLASVLFYQNYAETRDFIVGDVAFLSADEQVNNLFSELQWLVDEAQSEAIDRRETDREYYAESQGE